MNARNTRKQRSLQSGQAIVLMALAMMGLLAFVVLAIDGGRFYTQRRKSQNASDMAALAGLYRYAKAADPSTLHDSDVLSEINRVAEINEIADTNATAGDAINGNVQAWWVDKTGGIIRQIGKDTNGNANLTQAPPANVAAIKVFTQIPYPTFIGGLVGQASLTAQSDAIARRALSTIQFTDNKSSMWLGGSDCDNLDSSPNGKIALNYSNTNTAKFKSSIYSDGSLARGSINSALFYDDIIIRGIVGTGSADGPYRTYTYSSQDGTLGPFSGAGNKFTDAAIAAGKKYIGPNSPIATPKGFPQWAYITVNGSKAQLDAAAFKPGTGAWYKKYDEYYKGGMLGPYGNIPTDTFFNTIAVGATNADTLTNINTAYGNNKRGIYWIDSDLTIPSGQSPWQGVTLILTGKFTSQDTGHVYYHAGPMAFNISVLAGKDLGMPKRCASDMTNAVFSVMGNNTVFTGIIYVPYGQMMVYGNTTGGSNDSDLSKGIVAYSVYLGSQGSGSANSWQFNFDPSLFQQVMIATELNN